MPVITEDTIRQLAAFKGEGVPVTSCYLDVDGRRLPRMQDVEHELDTVLRAARRKANGTPSVNEDLARIESFVRAGLDRSRTRGLAIFSCSERDLWQVVPLPVSVRSRVVINAVPAVGQLESVVQSLERIGVLLVDRQRTRLFVFEMGELVERTEQVDDLPRDYDSRGEKERGDVSPHVDALVSQHIRRATDTTFALFQENGFELLCVGAPDDMVGVVESSLHPYLQQRLCGRVPLQPGAGIDEIRSAVLEVEQAQERAKEAALVSRLRDEVGGGRRGVAGLDATLTALNERRIDQLLVSDGYTVAGWSCPGCGALATVGRRCKVCDAEMVEVDDIVEEAVEVALSLACHVEVCVDNADLDVLGRIGALLRY